MLTYERAKDLLNYDSERGTFTWKVKRKNADAGSEAGSLTEGWYTRIGIDGKVYLAHHVAWLLFYGVWPTKKIDHKNRIKSDNWIENIREATDSQNNHNVDKKRSPCGYRGVYFHKRMRRWCVKLQRDGKSIHVGYFDDPETASDAYKKAVVELRGEFAYLD
jgi:hypothetical protein